MASHTPRLTVLMAVFNGAEYLRSAIDSVLGQTFEDFEFVVVNDGSTDESRAILESYADPRIVIVDNDSNIGLTRSLNKGLSIARGEFVARQDADDISKRERFARQVEILAGQPRVAIVGSQMAYLTESGRIDDSRLARKALSHEALRFQLLFDSPFVHSAVMFRTRIVRDELRGYAEDFRTNQDFELWSRLLERHQGLNLPDRLVLLRARGDSVSASYNERTADAVATVFARNLSSVLGSGEELRAWPRMWSHVAVGSNGPEVDGAAILELARRIFSAYRTRLQTHAVLREVRELYSINVLRLARHLLLLGHPNTTASVMESLRIAPSIALGEGVRAVFRLVGGRRRRKHRGRSDEATL